MKNNRILFGLVLILLFLAGQNTYSQGILKKMKEAAKEVVKEEIIGDDKIKEEPSNEESSSSSSVSNTRGGGLTTTPPDVMENIAGAQTAFLQSNYTDARFSVRQAVLGIEMEIGQKILEGLPESVKGLGMIPDEDKVESMSIGFTGLTIERVYRTGDQQLRVTIGNDALMLSAVNMYLSSGAYETEENQKRVTYKGDRGILEYDDYSGYTLSVPFGQSSIFVVNGINFASEEEIMSAAEEFDIEKIKTELGEQ
ncbi:MAG: hypothetical protein ISS19_16605 [Bacteroidales bacterium]|nr:hypothetical protein [Bacteroidales bacterium]